MAKECELLSAINSLPDGVDWLIRSDKQGFLANIMTHDFDGGMCGMNSHAYASTPILAFESAYKGFKANQKLGL